MNTTSLKLDVSPGESIFHATFRAFMEATLTGTPVELDFMEREMCVTAGTNVGALRAAYSQTRKGPVPTVLQTPEDRRTALVQRQEMLNDYAESRQREDKLWSLRLACKARLTTLPPMDIVPERWEDCQLYMEFDDLQRIDALARFAQYRYIHEECSWTEAIKWAFTKTAPLMRTGYWTNEKPFALQVLIYAWAHGPALKAALKATPL